MEWKEKQRVKNLIEAVGEPVNQRLDVYSFNLGMAIGMLPKLLNEVENLQSDLFTANQKLEDAVSDKEHLGQLVDEIDWAFLSAKDALSPETDSQLGIEEVLHRFYAQVKDILEAGNTEAIDERRAKRAPR